MKRKEKWKKKTDHNVNSKALQEQISAYKSSDLQYLILTNFHA